MFPNVDTNTGRGVKVPLGVIFATCHIPVPPPEIPPPSPEETRGIPPAQPRGISEGHISLFYSIHSTPVRNSRLRVMSILRVPWIHSESKVPPPGSFLQLFSLKGPTFYWKSRGTNSKCVLRTWPYNIKLHLVIPFHNLSYLYVKCHEPA